MLITLSGLEGFACLSYNLGKTENRKENLSISLLHCFF